jgi:hypothetical protein
MKRESLPEFLARGGAIKKVYYRTIDEVVVPAPGGMRKVINNGRQLAYNARQAGIASGAARRARRA